MAYHGYGFDPATGLEDDEIRQGLAVVAEENRGVPHPVAKARAIKYVLDNTKIDINEHDIFVGFWSVNRLAKKVASDIWWRELTEGELSDCAALMKDMNESGAVSIRHDFDHVIPDWDSILSLGFSGLRERAAKYRKMHRQNGTLTADMDAHFESIDIEYGAILILSTAFTVLPRAKLMRVRKSMRSALRASATARRPIYMKRCRRCISTS